MAETGMVERVARAIAQEIDCVDWTAPDNTMSHPARLNAIALDAARAAIEAMREPTEEMLEAGENAVDDGETYNCRAKAEGAYHDMLYAALSPKE